MAWPMAWLVRRHKVALDELLVVRRERRADARATVAALSCREGSP